MLVELIYAACQQSFQWILTHVFFWIHSDHDHTFELFFFIMKWTEKHTEVEEDVQLNCLFVLITIYIKRCKQKENKFWNILKIYIKMCFYRFIFIQICTYRKIFYGFTRLLLPAKMIELFVKLAVLGLNGNRCWDTLVSIHDTLYKHGETSHLHARPSARIGNAAIHTIQSMIDSASALWSKDFRTFLIALRLVTAIEAAAHMNRRWVGYIVSSPRNICTKNENYLIRFTKLWNALAFYSPNQR